MFTNLDQQSTIEIAKKLAYWHRVWYNPNQELAKLYEDCH